MKKNKRRILLIGWDAADWKVINPLMDNGMMPALESLVNNGVIGNIATLDPPLSPMLWTSISTGKHADKHGILGFMEPAPEGNGIRPVMITSRKVKAIWNMLSQSGYKTHVVGWWPSHPAEPINGISISNFYQRDVDEYGKPWHLPPGTVHPKEKEEIFKELRIHPGELTEAHILPFVPRAKEIDQEKDKRLSALGKITAHCSTIHSAVTWILENEDWDFMAVYYDSIDHYCHTFMKFHPPKIERAPENLFELYKDVVKGGYIYHDMMLSRLLQFVDENTTVILMSDHGFHSDHLRPRGIPDEPAGPAWEHRDYGILCVKGPGIKKDERIYGASLLDITPTILSLFKLPIGRDMEGKPLLDIFEETPTCGYVDSWEEIEGECGMHSKDIQRDPIAEYAAMQQLVELGYIEKPEENIQKNIEKIVDESQFYLARVYMHKGLFSNALPILEELYKKDSKVVRYAYRYAKCLDSLGKVEEANEIVTRIIENEEKEYPALFLLKGTLEYAKKNYVESLKFLESAEKVDPKLPQLYQQIGYVYLKMRRLNDAERAFQKAIEHDPENAHSHFGLGQVLYKKKDYENSANCFLNAVGLQYNFPRAHITLGIALAKLEMYDRAIEAFEVCLKFDPGFIAAHRYLSYIYDIKLKNTEKADRHIKALNNFRDKLKSSQRIV